MPFFAPSPIDRIRIIFSYQLTPDLLKISFFEKPALGEIYRFESEMAVVLADR